MSLQDDYKFRKFLETQPNKYGLVLTVAREAKELSEDYDDLILHSEAITHVVHGTKPRLKDITRWESEAFELKDMFCYIEDVDVCNAVYDSFYASKEAGNLVYKYNNITEPNNQARVRILMRMLWDRLDMNYLKGGCQTVAKRKKNVEAVETPVEQEAVLEAKKVEGEALPEITEENVDDVKESVVEETPVEAPVSEEVSEEKPAEEVKPKRTRRTKKSAETKEDAKAEEVITEEKSADAPNNAKLFGDKKSANVKLTDFKSMVASVKKAEKPAKKSADKGKAIELKGLVWLYSNSAILTSKRTISGTVYLWGDKVTNRYPVTDDPNGAGNLTALKGWVYATDLGLE